MIILGAMTFSHDAAAAIIKDGKVLFAAEEERYNREKHTPKFPHNAINACLECAGVGIEDRFSALVTNCFYPSPNAGGDLYKVGLNS